MQGIKTTEEVKQNILNQYIEGLQLKEISNINDVSQASVSNILKKLNIKPRRQSYTIEQEKEICDLYLNTELSSSKIASKFNTERTNIRNILNRNNINRTYLRKNKLVRNNPFENINDPETQYWLGILASDGYIQDRSLNNSSNNRVGYVIGLVNCKDSYILNAYIKFINAKLKIYTSSQPKSNYSHSTVSFCNKKNIFIFRIFRLYT